MYSITESVLDAVKILIDSALKDLDYDRTIKCQIKEDYTTQEGIDSSLYTYKVSYQDSLYTAVSDEEYELGDYVYACAAEGNLANLVIVGLAQARSEFAANVGLEEAPEVASSLFETNWFHQTDWGANGVSLIAGLAENPNIPEDAITWSKISDYISDKYTDETQLEQDVEYQTVQFRISQSESEENKSKYVYEYIFDDSTKYIENIDEWAKSFRKIMLGCDFAAQLNDNHTAGNYGIILTCEITYEDQSVKEEEFVLDINDMVGNYYEFDEGVRQYKVFDLGDTCAGIKLKKIKFFQENFMYDTEFYYYPLLEEAYQVIQNYEPNIKFSNITLDFVGVGEGAYTVETIPTGLNNTFKDGEKSWETPKAVLKFGPQTRENAQCSWYYEDPKATISTPFGLGWRPWNENSLESEEEVELFNYEKSLWQDKIFKGKIFYDGMEFDTEPVGYQKITDFNSSLFPNGSQAFGLVYTPENGGTLKAECRANLDEYEEFKYGIRYYWYNGDSPFVLEEGETEKNVTNQFIRANHKDSLKYKCLVYKDKNLEKKEKENENALLELGKKKEGDNAIGEGVFGALERMNGKVDEEGENISFDKVDCELIKSFFVNNKAPYNHMKDILVSLLPEETEPSSTSDSTEWEKSFPFSEMVFLSWEDGLIPTITEENKNELKDEILVLEDAATKFKTWLETRLADPITDNKTLFYIQTLNHVIDSQYLEDRNRSMIDYQYTPGSSLLYTLGSELIGPEATSVQNASIDRTIEVISKKPEEVKILEVNWNDENGIPLSMDEDNWNKFSNKMITKAYQESIDKIAKLHYNVSMTYNAFWAEYERNYFIVDIKYEADGVESIMQEKVYVEFVRIGDNGTNGTIFHCDIDLRNSDSDSYGFKESAYIGNNECTKSSTFKWSHTGLEVLSGNIISLKVKKLGDPAYTRLEAKEETQQYSAYAFFPVWYRVQDNKKESIQIVNNVQTNLPKTILYNTNGLDPVNSSVELEFNGLEGDIQEIKEINKSDIITESNEKFIFTAPSKHDSENLVIRVKTKNSSGNIFDYYFTIVLLINRYGNEAINGWDGNKLEIDENGQHIFTPTLGAGTKNDSNQFTGVMMGKDVQQSQIGIYGYKDGENTFGLMEDGSAYFGSGTQLNSENRTITVGSLGTTTKTLKKDPAEKTSVEGSNGRYIGITLKSDDKNILSNYIGQALTISFEIWATANDIGKDEASSLTIYPYQAAGISIADTFNFTATRNEWELKTFTTTIKAWPDKNTEQDAAMGNEIGIFSIDTTEAEGVNKKQYPFKIRNVKLILGLESNPEDGDYVNVNVPYGTGEPNDGGSGRSFKVSRDGLLSAKNAIIEGTVYAGAGNIAGWEIGPTSLVRKNSEGKGFGISLYPYIYGRGSNVLAIGNIKNDDDWTTAEFRVTKDGILKATGADITGKITATSGQIGSAIIGSNGAYYQLGGIAAVGGNWDNGTAVYNISGLQPSYVSNIYEYLIWAGAEMNRLPNETRDEFSNRVNYSFGAQQWNTTIQNGELNSSYTPTGSKSTTIKKLIADTANFYVTQRGKLYAKDAEIEGKIEATSGSIGGWHVKNNIIVNKLNSDGSLNINGPVFYLATPAAGYANYMVTKDDNSNVTFRISKTGEVVSRRFQIYDEISDDSLKNLGYMGMITGTATHAWTQKEPYTYNYTTYNLGLSTKDLKQKYTVETEDRTGTDVPKTKDLYPSIIIESIENIRLSASHNVYIYGRGHDSEAKTGISVGEEGTLKGTWSGGSGICTCSDINVKNTISSLSFDYSNLFDNLRPVTYKYNDGTSDRLHTGFIAQEVKEALDKVNINSKDFAGLVIFDRNTEEELWTLRYEEFIALNTNEIQKAKARISELETRVSQLESLLQANLD